MKKINLIKHNKEKLNILKIINFLGRFISGLYDDLFTSYYNDLKTRIKKNMGLNSDILYNWYTETIDNYLKNLDELNNQKENHDNIINVIKTFYLKKGSVGDSDIGYVLKNENDIKDLITHLKSSNIKNINILADTIETELNNEIKNNSNGINYDVFKQIFYQIEDTENYIIFNFRFKENIYEIIISKPKKNMVLSLHEILLKTLDLYNKLDLLELKRLICTKDYNLKSSKK